MATTTKQRWLMTTARILRAIALVFLLVLSLAASTFYFFVYTYDIDSQRVRIETYLSNIIHRKISIENGLNLQPGLGSVGIIAREVKIANADWANEPWFAEAGELRGTISLLDVLFNKIVISDISLTSAKVLIEKSPEGIANWPAINSAKPPVQNRIIPSILNVQVRDLEVVLQIKNRPNLNFHIQSIQAALPYGEPITLIANGNMGDIPIEVDLQGNTLSSLLNEEVDWPLRGKIAFPAILVNVDSRIKHSRDLFELDLHLHDVVQTPFDKRWGGWKINGLEYLVAEFKLKSHNNRLTIDLKGEIEHLELSYSGGRAQFIPDLNLNIGTLKFHDYGRGENINHLIQNAHSEYELKNSQMVINPDDKNKKASLNITNMNTRITPENMHSTQIAVTYNNQKIQARLEHGRLIDLPWNNQPWPYKAQINLLDSQFNTVGKITNSTIAGQFELGGKNLGKSLAYFTKHGPNLGYFQLSGNYQYSNKRLDVKGIKMKLADSIFVGDVNITSSGLPTLYFSFKSLKLTLGKLLKNVVKSNAYTLNAKALTLMGNSRGRTFQEWLTHLNIALSMPELAIEKFQDNVLLLKDIKIENTASASLLASTSTTIGGNKLNIVLHSPPIQSIRNEDTMPFVVDVNKGDGALRFEGELNGLKPGSPQKISVNGSVNAKMQNFARIVDNQKLTLPDYRNISLTANASFRDNAVYLTNMHVYSDEMSFKGALSYKPKDNLIVARLEKNHFDIERLLSSYGPGKLNLEETEKNSSATMLNVSKSRNKEDFQTIIPTKDFNFSALNRVNVDMEVDQLKLTFKREPITKLGVKLRIQDGVLDLSYTGHSSQVGSDTKANVILSANRNSPRLEMNVDLNNLDYGYLFKTLELTDAVRGSVNIDLELVASGNTSHELLKSATGEIAFISEKGRVPRKLLELWGAGFLRILLPTTWIEEDSTQLNCAVGYFKVNDGYLRSEALLADTERVTVAGNMAVNLLNENIQGIINTKSKSAALIKLATPIAVTGTIRHPVTAPAENKLVTIGKLLIGISQPYTMILLFGDLGADEKNPCAALLERAEQNEKPKNKRSSQKQIPAF